MSSVKVRCECKQNTTTLTSSLPHKRTLYHRRAIRRLPKCDLIHDRIFFDNSSTFDAKAVAGRMVVLYDRSTAVIADGLNVCLSDVL